MRWNRTTVATLLSVGLILGMTLTPDPPWLYYEVEEVTGSDPGGLSLEFLLNILLFVPLGMVLGSLRRVRLLPLAVALSVTVELLQFLYPDRSPKVTDVIANSMGALLGYLAFVVAVTLLERRRPQPVPLDRTDVDDDRATAARR